MREGGRGGGKEGGGWRDEVHVLVGLTLRPCQGRLPLRKYMNICPSASKSSRLLCSDRRRGGGGRRAREEDSKLVRWREGAIHTMLHR